MLTLIKQALNITKLIAKKVTKCKVCGKEFRTAFDRKGTNFCSKECSKQRTNYHYTCAYCQTPFVRHVLSQRVRNFCCTKCRCTYNNVNQNKIKMEAINEASQR